MSSLRMTINSNERWSGNNFIERKLGSVLDNKVASSTKHVLLDRIQFKEASKPDPFYQELKKKYTPINTASSKAQQTGGITTVKDIGKKCHGSLGETKDELPAPKYVLFEREKVNLQWQTIRSVGPGLFNLGNTCFLNSVIQVLTYTPPLVNYLATQEHSQICKAVGFCMLCELQRHIMRTFSHTQSEAIKPLAILQKLKYIAKHLRFGEQEDSHEFLRYVIDGMMKSCMAGVSEKLDAYTKATTMVHQVFGGYYRSQVTCENCNHISNTYDPLMEILLDIKHAHSVLHAMHKLISVEVLSGDNMYLCSRCKKKVPAKKHLTVHQAPNVMTMCLKRFDSHSLFGTKINKEINYPEHFNLRPFMSKTQGPPMHYKLYAVLVHSGYSCNSGHYYCFIKASNSQWYQMNDSSVRQVSLKTVLAQQAYLLFYIKDTKPQDMVGDRQNSDKRGEFGKETWTNGIKNPGPNQKHHLPKVISAPTRKPDRILAPLNVKNQEATKGTVNTAKPSRPTKLPQEREKIAFSLNQGTPGKKVNTSLIEKHESSRQVDGPDLTKSESKSSLDNIKESYSNIENGVESDLQVNEISSSKLEKVEGMQENSSQRKEKIDAVELTPKQDVAEGTNEKTDIHATTKWNVARNGSSGLTSASLSASLAGGVSGSKRERTPSLSSEISNPGSVASKTGEWSVCDRSSTQDIGPRLPERQHAGWKVSSVEDSIKGAAVENKNARRPAPKDDGEEPSRRSEKRKFATEHSGNSPSKIYKAEDGRPLLSDGSRDRSEDDDTDERRRKRRKKSRKLKKKERKSVSESDTNSEDENEVLARRKKRRKKSKKKKKLRKEKEILGNSNRTFDERENLRKSQEGEGRQEEPGPLGIINADLSKSSFEKSEISEVCTGERIHSNTCKRDSRGDGKGEDEKRSNLREEKDVNVSDENDVRNEENFHSLANKSCEEHRTERRFSPRDELESRQEIMRKKGRNILGKSKEFVAKLADGRKKAEDERKPLVQYSDDSSSIDEDSVHRQVVREDSCGRRGDRKEAVEKVKSWSCREMSSPVRDDRDRRTIVDTLLRNSRSSSNYGRRVETWEGEEGDETTTKYQEDNHKRRRDRWDEEYDRGKVKRTKNQKKFLNHSYHGENSFQREYNRKRMWGNGWHYFTPFSSGRFHRKDANWRSHRDRR